MSKFNMDTPVWVWLYDYGPASHPVAWEGHEEKFGWKPKAYPQAHTYAHLSKDDAMKYAVEHWPKEHGYILCKTYLQTELT